MPRILECHPEKDERERTIMPTFNDSENKLIFQPPGDYIFTVISHESKVSKGPKTSGSPTDEMKLELASKDGKTTSVCYETLIDNPSCSWKYDTFLKSSNVKVAKGASFQLSADPEVVGAINPLGLRGWCNVSLETQQNGKQRNKVTMFYTDKEKLARAVIAAHEPAEPIPFSNPIDDCSF